MRKKFTTVLSEKTISALELIANREEMSSKNNVIEYLVREYIRENDLDRAPKMYVSSKLLVNGYLQLLKHL